MASTNSLLQAGAGVGLVGLGFATGFTALAPLGAALVLGAGAQALSDKPRLGGGGGKAPGVNLSPTVPPERLIYGDVKVPGVPIFWFNTADQVSNNPDREYLTVLYAITRRRVLNPLDAIYIRGSYVALKTNNGEVDYFPDDWLVPVDGNKYQNYIGINYDQGNGLNPSNWLIDRSDGDWTDEHKLTSVAWAAVTFRFDPDLWPDPEAPSQTEFRLRGVDCFDPRNGITGYTANPALIWADMLSGVHGPRGGVSRALINNAALIAAANVCDEIVTKKDSTTTTRYQCNGWWDATEDIESIEEQILATMGGTRVKSGDSYFVYAASARSSVMDLTFDDLAGPVSIRPKRPREDLFNECKALYNKSTAAFTEMETVPYAPSTYRTADQGQMLTRELELRGVTKSEQAQRLVKIHLEQHRRQLTWSGRFKPKALLLKPMDVVRVTDDELGWNLKKFLIGSWSWTEPDEDGTGGGVDMELAEYDDAVFAWSASEEQDEAGEAEVPADDTSAITPILLDAPVFRGWPDTKPDDFGFYAGYRATDAGKRTLPVRLWRADSAASEYQPIARLPRPLIAGACNTVLPSPKSIYRRDRTATLTVTLDREVELRSVTDFDLRNGANRAYVGLTGSFGYVRGEHLQFATATRISGRQWQLSNFRRALFGTEDRAVHTTGEVFILLTPELIRIPTPSSLMRVDRWYRIAYEDRLPISGGVLFHNTAQGRRPIPPLEAWITQSTNKDLRIHWRPRVRGLYGWASPPPHNETEISYRLFVTKTATAGEREIVVFNRSYADYPDLMQYADHNGTVTQLTVRISQRDRVIGSGDYVNFPNLKVTGSHK